MCPSTRPSKRQRVLVLGAEEELEVGGRSRPDDLTRRDLSQRGPRVVAGRRALVLVLPELHLRADDRAARRGLDLALVPRNFLIVWTSIAAALILVSAFGSWLSRGEDLPSNVTLDAFGRYRLGEGLIGGSALLTIVVASTRSVDRRVCYALCAALSLAALGVGIAGVHDASGQVGSVSRNEYGENLLGVGALGSSQSSARHSLCSEVSPA